jgi:hypothetical protein
MWRCSYPNGMEDDINKRSAFKQYVKSMLILIWQQCGNNEKQYQPPSVTEIHIHNGQPMSAGKPEIWRGGYCQY